MSSLFFCVDYAKCENTVIPRTQLGRNWDATGTQLGRNWDAAVNKPKSLGTDRCRTRRAGMLVRAAGALCSNQASKGLIALSVSHLLTSCYIVAEVPMVKSSKHVTPREAASSCRSGVRRGKPSELSELSMLLRRIRVYRFTVAIQKPRNHIPQCTDNIVL